MLFFDGECNLCNQAVQFVIRHDRAGRVRFSALQSQRGQQAQSAVGQTEPLSTLILLHQERYLILSEAALSLCARLDWPWSSLRLLGIFPRSWLDAAYRFLAARRYRWFGRSDLCLMPTPELRGRFLD